MFKIFGPMALKGTMTVSTTTPTAGPGRAIFGFGALNYTSYSLTNLVSDTGVIATDTAGIGTVRSSLAAAGYGTDKAIFGLGNFRVNVSTTNPVSMTNLVSNLGVVATDTAGVGAARHGPAAAGYGGDKAIFGYGNTGSSNISTAVSMTNLVSNIGVVASDITGVGTERSYLAAAGYGTDKAIFGYGLGNGNVSITNLVSNSGVVASDTNSAGTGRYGLAATGYGGDKAIFGFGNTGLSYVSMTNLVSNIGVVATDTAGVGTARVGPAAAGYGGDKGIFGYGYNGFVSVSNLVSNVGIVANDVSAIGSARYGLAAASYG
jgi:hypothetical protein